VAHSRFSRRQVLTASLLGGGSLLAANAFARNAGSGIPWVAGTAPAPRGYDGARFFTASEHRCVDALVARLIPTDELGPGAREAGVADFIDNQLAGSFGRGERWYMKGPFADGLKTQGYQSEHPPSGLYRAAIAALDDHCRARFDGRVFAELDAEDQDLILQQLEDGELEFDSVSATAFFAMLQDNAIEGFFCDPIYGGNRDMVGWKLVGFPGARYDYRDYLDHNGEPISIEPVGLAGRPAWNVD
jgi:gluconate 2-dehydrogenase gamma chain